MIFLGFDVAAGAGTTGVAATEAVAGGAVAGAAIIGATATGAAVGLAPGAEGAEKKLLIACDGASGSITCSSTLETTVGSSIAFWILTPNFLGIPKLPFVFHSSFSSLANAIRLASCSATCLFLATAVAITVPSGLRTPIVKTRSCGGPTTSTSLYLGG